MKLTHYIKKNIIMDLESTESSACLIEMVRTLENGIVGDKTELISALLGREQLAPTGIGDGVAIPHTQTDAIKKPVILIGKSSAGINFFAKDGRPAHLIFLVLTPKSKRDLSFLMMSEIIKFLEHPGKRDALMIAREPKDILNQLDSYNGLGITHLFKKALRELKETVLTDWNGVEKRNEFLADSHLNKK